MLPVVHILLSLHYLLLNHLKVLSRDIRALHKRLGHSKQEGLYHVLLEHVDVSYDIEDEAVVLRGAVLGGTGGRVLQAELQQIRSHPVGITSSE